jgi:signal transduction histidine kinase
VSVRIEARDGALALAVRDDGAGLDAPADLARWEREGHMGLVGMRERIGALGGSVALENVEGGAVLRVWVPASPVPTEGAA